MHSVIIVDDEKFVRKGLISMVDWESIGFQVIDEADNGEDALVLIIEKNPDLVITDIRMPVLDGIGLIHAAVERKLETEFLIISGYNDFRYAQQAVRYGALDYILKPIDQDEIVNVLVKLKHKLSEKREFQDRYFAMLKEKELEAIICGDLEAEALENWEQPWRTAGARTFVYVLIELNNIVPWNDKQEPAQETLKRAIQASVQEMSSLSVKPVVYTHRQATGVTIPDHYYSAGNGNIRRYLLDVLKRLAERLPYDFRAYVGQTVLSLIQLHVSYTSAKEAMLHKYLRPADQLILYSDIEGSDLQYISLEDKVFRRLLEAVEEDDFEAIHRASNLVFAEFQEKRFSPEAMKATISQCVFEIVKSIRKMDGDEKDIKSLEPIINWHDFNITAAALRGIFDAFALEAAGMLNSLYRKSSKGTIHQIKCYVDQNYQASISLKSIATQFYINTAYLGQLFKKTYGVYFNDYLQQLRIAEAKKLLRQNHLRIYEIAEQVGFQNPDYFIAVFEKLERLTPTEYRNWLNNR